MNIWANSHIIAAMTGTTYDFDRREFSIMRKLR